MFSLVSTNVVYTVSLAFLLSYGIHCYIGYRRAIKAIQPLPCYVYSFFPAFHILDFVLPRIPGISYGHNHTPFRGKHTVHAKLGYDVYATVGSFPKTQITLFISGAEVIKEVATSKQLYPKPVELYKMLVAFGSNIVASEGDLWKKYRKVCAPAFSKRNNRLVWDETIKVMSDLFEVEWAGRDRIDVNHCVDITLSIALFVIGSAGFGRRISWGKDNDIPAGYTMSFKDAIHIVSVNAFLKAAVPRWIFGLTMRLRRTYAAFDDLEKYMLEMIHARKAENKPERYDLLSSLVDANDNNENTEQRMLDSELIGNTYIFLLAGHETTAHTLSFALALLALHPEKQDIMYEHVKSIIANGRLPKYEEMNALTYPLAVFYETLRMIPSVPAIPKYASSDAILTTRNAVGDKVTFPIPAGTRVVINGTGLHFNPKYWLEPHLFKPERFLEKNWPRDAFVPFSIGARACLGRRFSETESVAVLTMIILRYTISIKQDPRYAHESFEERKTRILQSKNGVSTTPSAMPLTFTRRE